MKKYLHLLPLAFNILYPLCGVFFFGWSIGDIFFLFFFELLILGGATIIKIFFSLKTGFGSRISIFFRFLLIYPSLFLFILILTGHFFDGGGKQMFVTIDKKTIYMLLASYGSNLLISFFINGKFKISTSKETEKETYYHMLAIFIVLFVLLWPLSKMMSFTEVNFALAVALILVKNLLDYFIAYMKKKELNTYR
ncbi:MAG: DUF6498-containing protein [Bacteroidota bacterium]